VALSTADRAVVQNMLNSDLKIHMKHASVWIKPIGSDLLVRVSKLSEASQVRKHLCCHGISCSELLIARSGKAALFVAQITRRHSAVNITRLIRNHHSVSLRLSPLT